MAGERSTTIRFTQDVYARLEEASRRTGLPINSIVTVACLDWLHNGTGRPGWLAGGPSFNQWRKDTAELRPGGLARGGRAEAVHHHQFEMFSASAQGSLERAQAAARSYGQGHIGTEHLLLGLRESESGLSGMVLERLGVSREFLAERLGAAARAESRRGPLLPSSRLRSVIRRAFDEAFTAESAYVGTEHLLLGMLAEAESVGARLLGEAGVSPEALRAELAGVRGAEEA